MTIESQIVPSLYEADLSLKESNGEPYVTEKNNTFLNTAGNFIKTALGTTSAKWMIGSKLISSVANLFPSALADLTSGLGYSYLQTILFQTNKWNIGGIMVDGFMKTDHGSAVKITDFPVQDGSLGSDHAVIQPVSLSIDIMMSDVHTGGRILQSDGNGRNRNSTSDVLRRVYNSLKGTMKINDYGLLNFGGIKKDGSGTSRSVQIYNELLALQKERQLIEVVTRLGTYKNMIIESISVPDDYKTYNALRCTVKLREVITVSVAEFTSAIRQDIANLDPSSSNAEAQKLASKDVNKTIKEIETKALESNGGKALNDIQKSAIEKLRRSLEAYNPSENLDSTIKSMTDSVGVLFKEGSDFAMELIQCLSTVSADCSVNGFTASYNLLNGLMQGLAKKEGAVK